MLEDCTTLDVCEGRLEQRVESAPLLDDIPCLKMT